MAESILFSAAAERNQGPILKVLRQVLPETGFVLEIAGGSGQHAARFAAEFPGLQWQSSDPSESAVESTRVRAEQSGLSNFLPPVVLDAERIPWAVTKASAVYCANMMHIAPWSAGLALLEGAARILQSGSPLVVYGPFLRKNVPTAQGNIDFDADLKRRSPAWGIRSLEAVTQVADIAGFEAPVVHEMPANNLLLVFRRSR